MRNQADRQPMRSISRPDRRRYKLFGGLLAAIALSAGWAAAEEKPTGNDPNPRLSALAENTATDLGPLRLENPDGEPEENANRVTDFSGMTYDPHNHRILMFGGGHATTFTDAIYAFDFGTLAWKALYKPTPQKFYRPENLENAFWKAGGEGPYPRPVAPHLRSAVGPRPPPRIPRAAQRLWAFRRRAGDRLF